MQSELPKGTMQTTIVDPFVERTIRTREVGDAAGALAESIAAEVELDLIQGIMSEPAGPLRVNIRGGHGGLPVRPNRNGLPRD
jgi:hypothetical protein